MKTKSKKLPARKEKSPARPKSSKTKVSGKDTGKKLRPTKDLGTPTPEVLRGSFSRYARMLLDLRDRLLDDIDFHAGDNLKRTQRDASSDLSAYSVHMADAGTDNFDREFALSMVSNEQEALYEIEDAIKRLNNKSFGTCEMCGKPIPKPRLDALPFARNCVACQDEFEKTNQKRTPETFRMSDLGNAEEEGAEKEEEE